MYGSTSLRKILFVYTDEDIVIPSHYTTWPSLVLANAFKQSRFIVACMFYEEFVIGSEQTTVGRTVTETDIIIFAGLTGANNPMFLDEEYSKNTSYGRRIAPGLLTLSIVTGLTYQLPTGPFGEGFIALLGMSFRALKPVFVGDTIHAKVVVNEKTPPKSGRGRIVLATTATNQRGEIVMEAEGNFLVKVKGT